MDKMNIVPLLKKQWKYTKIPMRYTTSEFYDVVLREEEAAFHIELEKKEANPPISHYPEEYDFPDKLYQDHYPKAFAWGVLDENGEMCACIETCPEEWSNRLMITELWVHEKLRRQGIGHRLMQVAKEQAMHEHRRCIILETQSCNTPAIAFYRHEGFELIGLDRCCYSNQDIQRREVRLNFGFFPRRPKVKRETVVVRQEREDEWRAVEQMTLYAFWNKYRIGCDEHLLVHKLRDAKEYRPELSRIAVVGEEIVGAIFYSKATLTKGDEEKEIMTFGPLCVAPEWQGCGIGGILLEETIALARKEGHEGIVIFGEPEYYPLHGFKRCENFGITTKDGKNFDAFMGYELVPGGLSDFGGYFSEADVFENLDNEELVQLTKEMNAPEKQVFPEQWAMKSAGE